MMMGCGLLWLLAIGLAALFGWQFVQEQQRRQPPSRDEGSLEALRIIEERYARGEISQQEFEDRRRALRGS